MVAAVKGRFTAFDGHVDADATGPLSAFGAVRVATLDTGDSIRDEHLRGARYFDAARHPEIRFVSTAIEPLDDQLRIVGGLTVKGGTHTIELHARPTLVDHRLELDVSGTLRRRELGIDSTELLDAGVSDRVTVTLQLSLVKSSAG